MGLYFLACQGLPHGGTAVLGRELLRAMSLCVLAAQFLHLQWGEPCPSGCGAGGGKFRAHPACRARAMGLWFRCSSAPCPLSLPTFPKPGGLLLTEEAPSGQGLRGPCPGPALLESEKLNITSNRTSASRHGKVGKWPRSVAGALLVLTRAERSPQLG